MPHFGMQQSVKQGSVHHRAPTDTRTDRDVDQVAQADASAP